jgi:hypothetical protein
MALAADVTADLSTLGGGGTVQILWSTDSVDAYGNEVSAYDTSALYTAVITTLNNELELKLYGEVTGQRVKVFLDNTASVSEHDRIVYSSNNYLVDKIDRWYDEGTLVAQIAYARREVESA